MGNSVGVLYRLIVHRKLESRAIRKRNNFDDKLSYFDKMLHRDGQTDGQTDRYTTCDSIHGLAYAQHRESKNLFIV